MEEREGEKERGRKGGGWEKEGGRKEEERERMREGGRGRVVLLCSGPTTQTLPPQHTALSPELPVQTSDFHTKPQGT